MTTIIAPPRMAPRDEHGQTLAEYALILALIAILAVVALLFLGGALAEQLSSVGRQI